MEENKYITRITLLAISGGNAVCTEAIFERRKDCLYKKNRYFLHWVIYSNHGPYKKCERTLEQTLLIYFGRKLIFTTLCKNIYLFTHQTNEQCLITRKNNIIFNCLLFMDPLKMKFWDVIAWVNFLQKNWMEVLYPTIHNGKRRR